MREKICGKEYLRLNDGRLIDTETLRDFGCPWPRGTAKKVIEKILCDRRWSKVSQAKIARHVGVTTAYVRIVKSEILKRQNGDYESKKAEKGFTK
jgi:hypothetical protein